MWNNTQYISNDLFQVYFNVSVSMAGQLNYLEEMEEQLQSKMAQQRASTGQRRERNRHTEEPTTKIEVSNASTKKLSESLETLSTKVGALKLSMDNLNKVTKEIQAK